MRDLARDWRKWSRAERLTAIGVIATLLSSVVPAAIEFALHLSTLAHHHPLN